MGLQKIEYNHTLDWTLTVNNAVGPTTSTTLGRTLSFTPTDVNAIWLAPNGSDANPGTQASPVLTLEHAFDIKGGKDIHIFRNGSGAALDFISTDDHTTDISYCTIQVELGETATIEIQQGWGDTPAGNPGNYEFNGIKIFGDGYILNNDAGNLSWCDTRDFDFRVFNPSTGDGIWKNSLIGANGAGARQIDDCVIFDDITSQGSTANNNVTNCTFVNANISGAESDSTIENCIFYFSGLAIQGVVAGTAVNDCLFLSTLVNSVATYNSGNIFGFDPLFFDINDDDARLYDRRRAPSGSLINFPFSSKAVHDPDLNQSYPGNRDLGAYDVSYTLATDTWDEYEFNNEDWNDAVDMPFDLINHQGYNDILGNFHRTFDEMKRAFLLKTIGNGWNGTRWSYEVLRIVRALGAKRWFPNGDDGIFAEDSLTVTSNADGTYSVTMTVANIIPDSFNGFVMQLEDGVDFYYFRIKTHTATVFTLEDHRGNQGSFTPGTWDLICLYIPVEIDQPTTSFVFENWNPQENPLMALASGAESEYQEGNARQLTLREALIDE